MFLAAGAIAAMAAYLGYSAYKKVQASRPITAVEVKTRGNSFITGQTVYVTSQRDGMELPVPADSASQMKEGGALD